MNHFQTERKAIHATGAIFTEFNWIFKEQQTVDLGIDAYVETPIDEENKIKLFALQIKGGEKNFHRSQKNLSFYFHERHYVYWKAISEICPVLIILQDSDDSVYWQHFTEDQIKKTTKHWKINIPLKNLLKTSKESIFSLIEKKQYYLQKGTSIISHPKSLEFYTYLDKKRKSLNIRFKNNSDNINLDLKYIPKPENWDEEKSFLSWEDPYYFTLENLINFINDLYQSSGRNIVLKDLLSEIIPLANKGIENLMEFFFNNKNQKLGIPQYQDFINAFKKYTSFKEKQFIVQAIDHIVLFHVDEIIYEIDTYEGKKATLKDYLARNSYHEIYTETERYIWSQIYIDPGIEKQEFIPILHTRWESYWANLYAVIKEEIGSTKHLDKLKERSFRELNGLINLYDNSTDIINVAYNFDDMLLYPLAVSTMLDIYDEESCLDEYCEFDFFASQNWESIELNEENWNSNIFFIKQQ